ncbi:MAG: gamma-glutamyltransferase [Opitutaceae bacterium]|nr:gamma-glutamyltransferase [Opitutaceae bacterium]
MAVAVLLLLSFPLAAQDTVVPRVTAPDPALRAPFTEANLSRPPVTGRRGMVTSLHPLGSMAGMKILLAGGNAFDAAVATALAVGVLDPKNSTLGGQGFATVYVAAEKKVRALNFFGPAPRAATREAIGTRDYRKGYLSTPVPSNLRGYAALHSAHGRLPWKEVVQPALELAEHGFVVTEELAQLVALLAPALDYPTSRAVFFPQGRAPRVGEIFRQPDLARTLRRVAEGGADAFYKGDIARRIGEFYRAHGGLLAYEDLAAYEATWSEPVSTTYRGFQVFAPPPNSSGLGVLLQLNILEGLDVAALGHHSPAHLHLMGEVHRLGIADRNRFVTDMSLTAVPVARLLDKAYAAERRKLLRPGTTMPAIPASPIDRGTDLAPRERENTTHLCVADAEGNLVSLTQTLGAWFGSGVVAADTGVLFSNQMRHLHTDPASPSRLEPGRRPRSNQSPLIVLKDGQPWLALGSPGSEGIWQRLVQVLVNMIDFKMDVQLAVATPRLAYAGGAANLTLDPPPVFELEDRLPAATFAALRQLGFTLKPTIAEGGSVNGIVRDPATGFLTGGADPRRWSDEGDWWGPAVAVYAIGW